MKAVARRPGASGCPERNIIKDKFERENNMGYEYAYTYPGMNKVLQAAGRTIRSGSDRGIVLLIGDRFTEYRYRNLFPEKWKNYKLIEKPSDMKYLLKKFWLENKY